MQGRPPDGQSDMLFFCSGSCEVLGWGFRGAMTAVKVDQPVQLPEMK